MTQESSGRCNIPWLNRVSTQYSYQLLMGSNSLKPQNICFRKIARAWRHVLLRLKMKKRTLFWLIKSENSAVRLSSHLLPSQSIVSDSYLPCFPLLDYNSGHSSPTGFAYRDKHIMPTTYEKRIMDILYLIGLNIESVLKWSVYWRKFAEVLYAYPGTDCNLMHFLLLSAFKCFMCSCPKYVPNLLRKSRLILTFRNAYFFFISMLFSVSEILKKSWWVGH